MTLKKTFLLIFFAGFLLLPADKYPPGLRWHEIGRGRFTVIFPAAHWQQAEAALAKAEGAYDKLAAFWGDPPAGRIRIVLNDSTDDANGFATFFPFNLVGVNLAEPPPDSEIAGSGDWLELVLTHELSHIFTLNAAAKPLQKLRRVFGSQPLFYPAVQLPAWVIEGLAVYDESRFTADGRLDHSAYPLMLAAARREGLFPGWSAISGMPAAWPGPSSKYLFGAGFMQYLADKYGSESLRRYLERSTSRLVQFSSNHDFEKTFGEPLAQLWEQYRLAPAAADGLSTSRTALVPLMVDGFSNQYPCPLGNDRLAYYHRDYQGRGALETVDLASGRKKVLCKIDAVNGLSFAPGSDKIYLSAADYFHAFSDFSDLYEFDRKSRRLKRLTRGQRLFQPLKKENADEIFCIQRRGGRFHLAIFDIGRQTTKALAQSFAGLAQLSLSPDQELLAAAVKPDGKPWGIGVFSAAGDLRAFFTAAGADCRQPQWGNNQTIYFIQACAKNTKLASLSLANDKSSVCNDTRLDGLQQFAVSGNGRSVYFTYFSGRGLGISRLDLAGLEFSAQELRMAMNVPETPAAAPKTVSRPYRFWRDLLPRYWTPAFRQGGDEFQAGIATGGQDALNIHSYSLEGYYGFSSRQANIFFQYAYDGLFPTLSFSYSDRNEYYRGHGGQSGRSQDLKLVSLWPLRIRRQSQLHAYADLHAQRRAVIYDWGTYEIPGSYNGLRLGLSFNSAREYYDSISPTDGIRLVVQGAVHPAGLGNHGSSRNAQVDLRQYIPLLRPGVLAWRLALARSWSSGRLDYHMGGREGEAGSSLGFDHPFDLLRGFPSGFLYGDRGTMLNLEYRLPLFKIEKAILPALSLDRVYINAFFDMGRIWAGTYSDTAYSVGGEAVLRLAFGGAAAIDLSFGAAYGFGPKRSWWIYLRSGRSF